LVHLLVFGVTYARCHVDTVDSPNDELSGAWNTWRIGINMYEKGIVHQVGYLQEFHQFLFAFLCRWKLFMEVRCHCIISGTFYCFVITFFLFCVARLKMTSFFKLLNAKLTLILLMWRIWWTPNNASKWQMGFNSALKGLNPNCHLLALLEAHHILHISRIRVNG
jgi:hypothetical protein